MIQAIQGLAHRIIKAVLIPVEDCQGPIGGIQQGIVVPVALRQQLERLIDGLEKVIQGVGVLMQIAHLHPARLVVLSFWRSPALKPAPQEQLEIDGFPRPLRGKHNVPMVGVNPLVRVRIQVQKSLKAVVVPVPGVSEIEYPNRGKPPAPGGKLQHLLAPPVLIPSAQEIPGTEFPALHRLRRLPVNPVLNLRRLHQLHGGDVLQVYIPKRLQLPGAFFQFFQRKIQRGSLLISSIW